MDRYLQFESIDFAQDEFFIKWVRQNRDPDTAVWEKWLVAHPDKVEDVNEARRIVLALKFKEDPISKDVQSRVWSVIDKKTSEDFSSPRRLWTWGSAIAAAFIIGFIFWPAATYDTSIYSPVAQTRDVTLPDGSLVQLNMDSRVQYHSGKWEEYRKVQLNGEAFFKVKKGSSFEVDTEYGLVRVLGTEFNVFVRDQRLLVSCESGSVLVKSEREETILKPGDRVRVTEGKHVRAAESTDKTRGLWRDGLFIYNGSPLPIPLGDIARLYDVDMEVPEQVKVDLFTGSFKKSTLESALMEVCWPLGLDFELKDGVVQISKKE